MQIQDIIRDLLHICKLFREGSMERHILRSTVQITLHLLFSHGMRAAQFQAAIHKFRQGKWEQLWTTAMKIALKLREKREKHLSKSRARSDTQKDAYAQKFAKAGNLSKANKIVCSEMLPACGDNTLPRL
jgi:hypothetical protein